MELKKKILNHPFYQAWSEGKISKEQLSNYGHSYLNFVKLMPEFWSRITSSFDINNPQASAVIREETEHIYLWEKWITKLPETENKNKMEALINEFNNMTSSELLGAVHAFEIQQPQVARTKKEGLLNHYGFNEADTVYFDEHMNEAEHIKFGEYLKDNYADKNEFNRGFEKGSEKIYDNLNLFM